MSNSGWEGILDNGEEILWQGRPDGAVRLVPSNLITMVFGLFFAGFALFWMIMASSAGGGFWMFGLLHFAVGIGLAFGSVFKSAFVRRRTWYTLTNRRAFIATELPITGKQLKSYPIAPDTVLDYSQGDLSTIHFSEVVKRGQKGRTYIVKIGFERISEGDKVYRLMRDMQKGEG